MDSCTYASNKASSIKLSIYRDLLCLSLVLFLSLATSAFAQGNSAANKHRGAKAIQELGDKLPLLAAKSSLSPGKLRNFFRTDDSLWIDLAKKNTPKLFYVEDPVSEEGGGASGGNTGPTTTNIPLTQTFLLHSKPGSQRTIYLDFNGHVISGTAWNNYAGVGSSYNAPAYNFDGTAASFSDIELARIINIWRRVAEDFSPFDVNVTTEEPSLDLLQRSSSTDLVYGTRALITTDSNLKSLLCGSCGGIAYVGIFNSTNNTTYQPALVFADALGNGNEKYVAEAVSHEVGHNGGLSHDGTASAGYYTGHGSGNTGWAPIMGVGYYQPLVQWSRGEYPGANNTQDDYVVFAGKGLSFRADDHGSSAATATPLGSGAALYAVGTLEQRTDKDFFSFSADVGNVTIESLPYLSTNLDIELSVYNSSGSLLAGPINPATLLTASVSFSAPYLGNYYVAVDGVGFGDLTTGYSDYGTVGEYTLSIAVQNPGGGGGTTNVPPVAVASSNISSGAAPLTVNFSSAGSLDSDGSIVTYGWNFGDGTSSTSANPTHIYTAAGNFTAILTVTDNAGAIDTDSVLISVAQAPSDATPPTVAVTSPANGATLPPQQNSTVTLAGTASDAGALSWIKIYLNGSLKKTCSYSNLPTTGNCSKGLKVNQFANGANNVTVSARDVAGNEASNSITVYRQ